MQQKDIDQRSQAEKAYDLATLRVLVAAQRLGDRLRFEMRYNPNWPSQPRVPAGEPLGPGRWTVDDLGGGGQPHESSPEDQFSTGARPRRNAILFPDF
jgi:hypothetical protein